MTKSLLELAREATPVAFSIQGHTVLIDALDAELLSQRNWYVARIRHNLYVRCSRSIGCGRRTTTSLHREILCLDDPAKQIDHINGDGLDNRRSNLRVVSRSLNGMNSRMREDNSSGFRGVTWHKTNRKWQATMWVDGESHHLGAFDTPEAASDAYQRELVARFPTAYRACRALNGD